MRLIFGSVILISIIQIIKGYLVPSTYQGNFTFMLKLPGGIFGLADVAQAASF